MRIEKSGDIADLATFRRPRDIAAYDAQECVASPKLAIETSDTSRPAAQVRPQSGFIIVDHRPLLRECFTRSLRMISDIPIHAFPTVESWLEVADQTPAAVILLCTSGPLDGESQRQIAVANHGDETIPVAVMSDAEDPEVIVGILNKGARGYIATSMSLAVTLQALRLVAEGGVFIPAASLMAAHRQQTGCSHTRNGEPDMFTSRQAAVIEALCNGKPNKIIAYELNMCESTVKVHVRNIMKKLKAKNRTQVAMIVKRLGGDIKNGSAARDVDDIG